MNEAAEVVIAAAGSVAHLRRLKHYYRSAGWPVRDALELDLIGAGHVELRCAPSGHESVYVTALGLIALNAQLARNRQQLEAHESLCARVAEFERSRGRLAFTGTRFKVRGAERWLNCCPDVFSIGRSLDERHIAPRVCEIKVSRADLLADLRNAAKREGYLGVSAQFYYVWPEGLAEPAEVPPECGVMTLEGDGRLIERRVAVVRPNPLRPMHWLQLVAHLAGAPLADDESQLSL